MALQGMLSGSAGRKLILKKMSQLVQDVMRINKGIVVPILNVTGLQSAGKTSLIEILLGAPYGYKDIATASRCPVILRCISNREATSPAVSLNGEAVSHRDLVEKMQEIMMQIKDDDRFSEKPVKIDFESDWVPDIVLIDHIGFRTSFKESDPDLLQQEKDDAEKICRIAARFIRDPNAIVVAVFNCPDGMDGFVDHLIIDDVMTNSKYDDLGPKRADWQQDALMVVNKFNQKSSLFRDLQDVNGFLESARNAPQDYHFVALKPDEAKDPDRMEFEGRCEYFRSVPTLEQDFFNNFKREKASRRAQIVWDSGNDAILGVVGAFDKILTLWERSFRREIPNIIKLLENEAERVRFQIAELPNTDLFHPDNVEKVKSILRNYALDFVHQMQHLYKGEMVKDKTGHDVTNFANCRRVFSPSTLGKTFSEELDCFLGDPSVKKSILDTVSACQTDIGAQRPLQGNSSYRRVITVFEYVFLHSIQSSETASDDDIANADNLAAPRLVAENDIVMQIAADQVLSLSDDITWLFDFLRKLYVSNVPAVHQYMQSLSEYAALKHLAFFIPMLNNAFYTAVNELVQDARRQWQILIKAKAGSRRHAGMIKGLLAFTVLKLPCSQQPVGRAGELLNKLLNVCAEYQESVDLVDVVQDPIYRAVCQQQGRFDGDHLRKCARLQSMQMAVEVVSMFTDILEANLVQAITWTPLLDKKAVAVVADIEYEHIKASVDIDPGEVESMREEMETQVTSLEDMIHRAKDLADMHSKL